MAQLSKSLQSTCGLQGTVLRTRASDGNHLPSKAGGAGQPGATLWTHGSEAEEGLVQGNPLCNAF